MGLLGSVCLFLYGMKVMSEGLQKAAGDRLRHILSAMTRNRFKGVLTGFTITALIQSSSASTVMVVSFVNAGLMTLAQSMAVIFGANVGTTFTAWIIALFGFKVDISAVTMPILAVAVPMLFMRGSRTKSIGEFLVGFSLLFLGLNIINDYVPDLQSNPEIFESLSYYTNMGIWSLLLFILVGVVLTCVIQSSAATFAITLIMCSKGWIEYPLACGLVLGAALGTAITPVLASLSGNIAAKRTAAGHVLFNVLGMTWLIAVFYPFVHMTAGLTEWLGLGDPTQLYEYTNNLKNTDPALYNQVMANSVPSAPDDVMVHRSMITQLQVAMSFGLSVFYTTYKLINVSIMIWFTKLYVRIVERLLPSRHKEDEEFSLKFISGGLLNASELNITQAEKEIGVYAERVGRMITMAQDLVHTKSNSVEFNKLLSRIDKYEDISDRMEIEIAKYLNHCAEGRLSNDSKLRLTSMLGVISEIESIADCCYGLGKIMVRKSQSNIEFSDDIMKNIDTMFGYVGEAMTMMNKQLANIQTPEEREIIDSYNKEREINNMRNQLRSENVTNINNGVYQYQEGIYYMDIIGTLEKTGDYIINVIDAIKEQYRHQRPRRI